LRKYRFLDVLNLVSVGGIAQLKQAFAAEEAFRVAGFFSGQSINRAPKLDRTKSALAHNRRARLFNTLRLWQKEHNAQSFKPYSMTGLLPWSS
jgi:hypothetical protein